LGAFLHPSSFESTGGVCRSTGASDTAQQLPIFVALKHPDQTIRTGDQIDVDWDARPSLDYLRCRTPPITGVIYHRACPVRGDKFFAFPLVRQVFIQLIITLAERVCSYRSISANGTAKIKAHSKII
jgi:hypothetical protein